MCDELFQDKQHDFSKHLYDLCCEILKLKGIKSVLNVEFGSYRYV